MKITYIAAHAGISLGRVPIGGGGAVCTHLVQEWARTQPFEFELVSPAILGDQAPGEFDLVRMSEGAYARFCQAFGKAATEQVLGQPTRPDAVLCNDVSEGPDFKRLAESGCRVFTIYHVDVLDYFVRMYLRGCVRPERAAAFFRAMGSTPLRHAIPSILDLVFKKQEESVRFSRGLIVPSVRMREVLLNCYPGTDPGKIHVIPWGLWEEPVEESALVREVSALRTRHTIPPGAPVLVTLSRLSPEKGQDRLLEALALWERDADFPKDGLWLFISGEPAFMQGVRFERKLRNLAAVLKKSRVIFPGYAAGVTKQALFRLADLYVFPSRHESYGLTMLEAMRAGVPVLATATYGARDIFTPAFGEMIPSTQGAQVPVELAAALKRLLMDPNQRKAMGLAGMQFARSQRFSDAAARLAEVLAL